MFSFQVVLSKTTRVDHALGKSINLLKCVCHASLCFIDPFNNPIIKLMCCLKEVNLFDTCGKETPLCLLIFRSVIPYWNLITVKNEIIYLKKNASRFSISPIKWTSKPESRQCNEKADNLRPKSGDLAGLNTALVVTYA